MVRYGKIGDEILIVMAMLRIWSGMFGITAFCCSWGTRDVIDVQLWSLKDLFDKSQLRIRY